MAHSPASQTPPTPRTSHWPLVLRVLGAVIVITTISWWIAAGRNTGWTKDQVGVTKTDEITGIEYVEYQKRFVPGAEFAAAGTGLGLALIAATLFSRRKS